MKYSHLYWRSFFQKGFTLIELLIVIAILGVLAAGLMLAINPNEKIAQSGDSRVQNDIAVIAGASESYATTHSGYYPSTIADLLTDADLKTAPIPPSGYGAYAYTPDPSGCIAGTTCTSVVITSQVKSSRYKATPFLRFESSTGKICNVATAATSCP